MGGFFGVVSKQECVYDLFFGTDYHSHLGTRRGGMAVYSKEGAGFQRSIHNIENSPFRTRFEKEVSIMRGTSGIGSISDNEPQPLIVRSRLGNYAITTVGRINNVESLVDELFAEGRHHFLELTGGEINPTELVSALIDQKSNFVEGLLHVQEKVEGSMSILLLTPEGMYAARDRYGRTPIVIGKKDSGYCAAFEAFSYLNLGYTDHKALGPGEIAFITPESYTSLSPPREEMRMCAFLWVYYGYPASSYEGKSVEEMRYDSGKASAAADRLSPDSTYPPVVEADIVAGIPDSGTAHAIGYANASGVPFNRPFIKYTPTWPRSFTPPDQTSRSLIARMKLIPVDALIRGKRIILTEDSIVRGTQLNGVTKLLYQCGAKEIHMRVSCPPNMFTCPYLNFTRSTAESNLIARRSITKLTEGGATWTMEDYTNPDSPAYAALLEEIREELGFTSLGYNRLEDTIGAIGLPKCRLCTYCWNGKG